MEKYDNDNINSLVLDCSNSIANALELLQSYTKIINPAEKINPVRSTISVLY